MSNPTNDELLQARTRWLQAARLYYLEPGEDTGMDDYTWDHLGRVLFANRERLPSCPVLNEPSYQGGSLFWVKRDLYAQALAVDPLKPVFSLDDDTPLMCSRDQSGDTTCEACQ